jgi:hypothetical protein
MRNAQSKVKRMPRHGRGVSWLVLTDPRHLTLFFWVYLAQAAAGSVIGFAVPFLYYFGFL